MGSTRLLSRWGRNSADAVHSAIAAIRASLARTPSARINLKAIVALIGLTGAAAMVAVFWAPRSPRAGNTITVNTLLDNATAGDEMCTLREAINNSNAVADTTNGDCMAGGGAGDAIVFSVSGKISLASTLPATKTLNLVVNGGGTITLDGGGSNQIFQVANGALDPREPDSSKRKWGQRVERSPPRRR